MSDTELGDTDIPATTTETSSVQNSVAYSQSSSSGGYHMKSVVAPPAWMPKSMMYDEWRFQVKLWSKMCDRKGVEKSEQAYLIYSVLRVEKEKNLSEIITSAIQSEKVDIFHTTDAVENIIQFLDSTYKKDDMTTMHINWKAFINIRREKYENMIQFIKRYDATYLELKRCGIVLPTAVLGLQLLERSEIQAKDKQTILTGLKCENSDEIFEQMKQSIRNYFDEQIDQDTYYPSNTACFDAPIQNTTVEEPVFEPIYYHEQAIGFKRPRPAPPELEKGPLRVPLWRPTREETIETNVMIENVPESWDDSDLYEQFCVYGQIIKGRVLRNVAGNSRGKAYVRYNLKTEAEDAILALNGIDVGGTKDLIVRFFDPPVTTPKLIMKGMKKKTRSVTRPYPSPMRTVRERPPYSMVRDTAKDPYSDHIMEAPSSRGDPQSPLYYSRGRDKLLSHVAHEALPVIEESWSRSLHPHSADSARQIPRQDDSHDMHIAEDLLPKAMVADPHIRPLYCIGEDSARQIPKHDDSETLPADVHTAEDPDHNSSYDPELGWCVFVYNLPNTASDSTFRKLFSEFGPISSVKVAVNVREPTRCRGFGFVHMVSYDDACRAIQSLDKATFQGKVLQVRFRDHARK